MQAAMFEEFERSMSGAAHPPGAQQLDYLQLVKDLLLTPEQVRF